MELLRKFLLFPTADKWLLVKAALLLGVVKLGVRLLPFRIVRRFLTRMTNTPTELRRMVPPSVEQVVRAVEVASRYTPGGKGCLTQALAAQVLLARRGYPALLHIGVARGEQGRFQAHAWVESEGKAVIGGPELEHFALLAVLEGTGS